MKIFELISYKTSYYYLKDTRNLNLSHYKFEENLLQDALEVYKEDNEGDLYDMFSDDILGTSEDIVEIKTNYGSIIFHKGHDYDYVKEFLELNSKNAPCAYFASHRVSDYYIFAYAENGEVERYLANSEEGCILEGTKTEAEIACNLNYTLESEDSFIQPYVGEDDIVNIASKIIDFNIQEDVEVLAINYYSKIKQLDDKTIPTFIDNRVIENIHENLKKHNELIAAINLCRSDGKLYIISFSLNHDEILYADILTLTDREEFIHSISRCLNVLSNAEYYNNPKHISKSEQVLKLIGESANLKQVVITTNINHSNTLSVSKINSKSILPKKLLALLNIKIFKNFKQEDLIDIYNYCIKKLF